MKRYTDITIIPCQGYIIEVSGDRCAVIDSLGEDIMNGPRDETFLNQIVQCGYATLPNDTQAQH